MAKKETTIIDIEGLMSELFNKLKDNNLSKKEHTEIVKKLKFLEQHYRNVADKKTNGKKYPEHLFHSGPEPMNKKEVLKLIDSVDEIPEPFDRDIGYGLDLSGVSVGKDRFIEIDQDIDIRTHEK